MAQALPFSFDGDWTPDQPMAAQVAALVQARLEQGWALFQLLEAAVHGEIGLEPYTVPWLWFGAMMAEVEQRLKDTMKSRL